MENENEINEIFGKSENGKSKRKYFSFGFSILENPKNDKTIKILSDKIDVVKTIIGKKYPNYDVNKNVTLIKLLLIDYVKNNDVKNNVVKK